MYCLSTYPFSPKDYWKKSVYRSPQKLVLFSHNLHTPLVSYHLLCCCIPQTGYATGTMKLCFNTDLTTKVSDKHCFRIVLCTVFKLSHPTKVSNIL